MISVSDGLDARPVTGQKLSVLGDRISAAFSGHFYFFVFPPGGSHADSSQDIRRSRRTGKAAQWEEGGVTARGRRPRFHIDNHNCSSAPRTSNRAWGGIRSLFVRSQKMTPIVPVDISVSFQSEKRNESNRWVAPTLIRFVSASWPASVAPPPPLRKQPLLWTKTPCSLPFPRNVINTWSYFAARVFAVFVPSHLHSCGFEPEFSGRSSIFISTLLMLPLQEWAISRPRDACDPRKHSGNILKSEISSSVPQ